MQTDLELLIDHMQSEVDTLQSEMDACIADWDFKRADALKMPLMYTRSKLLVLKNLENPNFGRISNLKESISRMEKILNENLFDELGFKEASRKSLEFYKQKIQHVIKKSTMELESLQAIEPRKTFHDDKILDLLEALEQKTISEVEFEIRKDRLYLLLQVKDDIGELSFFTSKNASLDSYIGGPNQIVLQQLGFDTPTFRKQIPNFTAFDKTKLLETLSIIYFEIYGIFGAEVMIKVR